MPVNFCQIGVNLGGWISQYRRYDHDHFRKFITAPDIRQIADWGMDHVRLPVDYPVLEDEARPFIYRQDGFDYVERCLEWCQENALAVVLDLHKAPGYSFDDTIEGEKPMPLFHDPQVAERFYRLWEEMARRFVGRYPHCSFELLNEVNLPDSAPWNRMIRQVVARIRAIEPNRTIVVGSNKFDAVSTLHELDLLEDPNIVYTFHFYEPLIFTHQRAYWSPINREHNATVDYPGVCTGLEALFTRKPEFRRDYGRFTTQLMDQALLREYLQPALDFMAQTGQQLYCGEYGVYEKAPLTSSLNWHRDFIGLLEEYRIGRAVWSYKGMGFGLVDLQGKVNHEELVKIVCSRR